MLAVHVHLETPRVAETLIAEGALGPDSLVQVSAGEEGLKKGGRAEIDRKRRRRAKEEEKEEEEECDEGESKPTDEPYN